jgi:hypothetical protein
MVSKVPIGDIASFSTAKTVFQKYPQLTALTLSLSVYLYF